MITIAGQIETIATRKDKTIKLSIGTQELSPDDMTELFKTNQQFCYIAIKPELFISQELDAIDSLHTEFDAHKTPSQRLRGILYINYQQKSEGYKDFNSYYLAKMESICEHFKSKLD